MQPFQKPENALTRAHELQEVGQNGLALQVLHLAIGHKKFKLQGWDIVQEQIMLRYIQLCVDLKKVNLVRDGLHQYRAIALQANIHSLAKVICEFRDKAEKQLKDVKSKITHAGDQNIKEEILKEDLDSELTPESLILSTLQIEVRDSSTRELHVALKFLWEAYKIILDNLRGAPKLEKLYHNTAHKAFLFCKENERLQEFKRLCELLRMHFAFATRSKYRAEMEKFLNPEIHMDTRILQLNVACEMSLWREAYNTAEDIHNLGIHDLYQKSFRLNATANASGVSEFVKSREKVLKWLAVFYEKVAKILWVSDNYLFHSLAQLKYLLHVRRFKKTIQDNEMQTLASTALLAVLAIPISVSSNSCDKKITNALSTSISIDASELAYEHNKKMVGLLGHSNIPSRESLKHALFLKDIFPCAAPNVQKLYAVIENDFTPLGLCAECSPLLEELSESFKQYVYPIKKVIFHKLIKQLSKVYTSISVDYFVSSICPNTFLPWNEAEKVLVSLVYEGSVQMRLDYSVNAIYFGTATQDPARTMRKTLADLGRQLHFCLHTMIKQDITEKEKLEKKRIMESIQSKLEEEHIRIKQRNKENDQRRLEKQEEQARAEEEKKKQQEALKLLEETQERKRREEALKKREEQRMKEEKYKAKSETAQQMLEEIKKIGGGKDKGAKIIIKGKQLDEINIEDVLEGTVVYEDFEKAQEEQRNKERSERIRQRKVEAKRMDHFVRACREEEKVLLLAWKQKTLEADTKVLLELQSKHEEEHKAAFQEALEEKQMFEVVIPDKKRWVEQRMQARRIEFDKKFREQSKRLLQLLKQRKIERARDRRDVELEKQRIEAEKKKKEEEEKRLAAEREAKRLEEEARTRKLEEMAEKQRLRELEIEEKHRLNDYEDFDKETSGMRRTVSPRSRNDDWRPQDNFRMREEDDERRLRGVREGGGARRGDHREYFERSDRLRERDRGRNVGDEGVRHREERLERDSRPSESRRDRYDRFERERESKEVLGGVSGGGRYDRERDYDRDRRYDRITAGGNVGRYDRDRGGGGERMYREDNGKNLSRDQGDRHKADKHSASKGVRERTSYGNAESREIKYSRMSDRETPPQQQGVEAEEDPYDGVDEEGFTTIKRKGRK